MAFDRRDVELERFKLEINLTEYAAASGYRIDRRRSSRHSVTMRHPSGGKIIVTRAAHDRHWTYFSVHDLRDSGSVIDFVLNRSGGSLGDVRKELRPWLGSGSSPSWRPSPDHYAADVVPTERDLVAVRTAFEQTRPIDGGHDYLERERALPASVLADPVFAGRIHVDARGNAIFPHYDLAGLVGFEIKNRGFTGFAKGGEKGLWGSRPTPLDCRLVIAETAIDALSYGALHGVAKHRFVSTAGQLNPEQPELLKAAMMSTLR